MRVAKAISVRINYLCLKKNYTFNSLAYSAAIPPSTIKNIIYGKSKNPGIVTIAKICDGLNITLYDFFSDEIFKNLEQEIE